MPLFRNFSDIYPRVSKAGADPFELTSGTTPAEPTFL